MVMKTTKQLLLNNYSAKGTLFNTLSHFNVTQFLLGLTLTKTPFASVWAWRLRNISKEYKDIYENDKTETI